MTETIKCQHCGTLVGAEKAFCPNCSEPMEPEEAPARETYISGEMMTTIRDDPEKYKHLLKPPVKQPPAQAEATPTVAAQRNAPAASFSAPNRAPDVRPSAPGTNKSYVILGISLVSLLILLFVILWLLKVF